MHKELNDLATEGVCLEGAQSLSYFFSILVHSQITLIIVLFMQVLELIFYMFNRKLCIADAFNFFVVARHTEINICKHVG